LRVAVISFSALPDDARVRRQVQSFIAEGWEVEALVTDGPADWEGLTVTAAPIQRRRAGVLRYLWEYAGFFLRALVWVRRLARRRAVDVVYVNSPPDALSLACVPAKRRGVPVVLDVHDPMPELWAAKGRGSGLVFRALAMQERIGARFADEVITVHEPMRRLLTGRSPGVSVAVVMNTPEDRSPEPLAHDPDSRLLVFAGTVAYRYGLDDVVEAMAMCQGEISGLSLRVIGAGEDLSSLIGLAERRGVVLEPVGRVPWSEVRKRQEGAWAGVNVPKPDALGELSFSNKVVEWISLGLPVIASRTSTLEAYFPPGCLEYVSGGAPESIAEGLIRLHRWSAEDRRARVDAAKGALEAISWPVQRETLLETVRAAAHRGKTSSSR